jgi:hypothetical protein
MSSDLLGIYAGAVWDAWSSVGAGSWAAHRDVPVTVDVDSLVVASEALAQTDPRLVAESRRWAEGNANLVSRARVKRLLAAWNLGLGGELEAAVASRDGTTGRSIAPIPSTLQLRLRAALGMSASTELLRILVSSADRWSVAALADEAAYTKRNVAKAVGGLVASGVVKESMEGRTVVYELADAGGFATSFAPVAVTRMSHGRWLRSAWLLAEGLERLRSAPPGVRSVEARALVDGLRHGLQEPLPDLPSGDDSFERLVVWAERYVDGTPVVQAHVELIKRESVRPRGIGVSSGPGNLAANTERYLEGFGEQGRSQI